MKTKILVVLLFIPTLFFAQRGHVSDNVFHNRSFWKEQPTIDIIKEKIEEGNDAIIQNKAAFDALSLAIMAKAPVETIDYLLSLPGIDVNRLTHDNRSYLMWTGYSGDIEVMKLLLSKGADTQIVGSHGFNWFTFTVNAGQENKKIYELMADNDVDLTATNRAGANAILLLARHSKDGEILKYFQKKGLDINAIDSKGNNLLFYAAQRGNTDLIKKYIKKGFDYKKVNADGENLVLYASHGSRGHSNSLEVFKYLASLGIEVAIVNNKNQNAMHFIASSTKDTDVIDFFIENGVDMQQVDKEGNTPFLNAARANNLIALQKITPSVKDINQKNTEGFSAITYATKRISAEVFNFLVENGADLNVVDKEGNNLYYHLFNGYNRRTKANFETVADALKKANVPFNQASKETTALHIAVEKGDQKLIATALDLGAEINKKNKEGLTPLHLAAMKANNTHLLKMLLKKGADKSILTDFEESAYDLAQENELLKKNKVALNFLKQS